MGNYPRLLQLSGADDKPAFMQDSVLLLIDYQNEYLQGPLALEGAGSALDEACRVLDLARLKAVPIIHVAHRGRRGGFFDREALRGQFVGQMQPLADEFVIEKSLPNAFAGTDLASQLTRMGRQNLIIAGWMTHNCVAASTWAALDLGYRVTLVADACATRPLPGLDGSLVSAQQLHLTTLAGLADRAAILAENSQQLQ